MVATRFISSGFFNAINRRLKTLKALGGFGYGWSIKALKSYLNSIVKFFCFLFKWTCKVFVWVYIDRVTSEVDMLKSEKKVFVMDLMVGIAVGIEIVSLLFLVNAV